MGMPSREELTEALEEAARMREAGADPHHLAKALLNHNYRLQQLEHVLEAAERYLHSGQAVTEHQRLRKAIEEARSAMARTAAAESTRFGLD